MATVTTTQTETGAQARSLPYGLVPFYAQYEATALSAGDVIQALKAALGVRILYLALAWDALGAGCILKVGDGSDTDRFITEKAADVAGVALLDNPDGLGYQYAAADTIDIVLTGASATGTITLVGWGCIDP